MLNAKHICNCCSLVVVSIIVLKEFLNTTTDEEKLAMAGASQFITNASPSLVKGLKSDKIKMTYIEEKTNIKSPLQQREEELSSLENEEKKISEVEALIEQQKEGQDRGE